VNHNKLSSHFSSFDRAFADFLNQKVPSTDPNHKKLVCLVSHLYSLGHTCLDLSLLTEGNWDALGLDYEIRKEISAEWAPNVETLPWINGDGSPLVLDKNLLYLRKNWEAEQRVIQSIMTRLRTPTKIYANLESILDLLFDSDADQDYPDWQKLACAIATLKPFTLITGGPGTGKTTTVTKLLSVLIFNARNETISRELRVALAAPTGKAAARLGESIQAALAKLPENLQFEITEPPVTLHKLLQIRSSFEEISNKKMLNYDVIVIDEASMVDLSLIDLLLSSALLSTWIIFLGDKDQLSSVEVGAVLGQLCKGAELGNYNHETISWLSKFTSHDLSNTLSNRAVTDGALRSSLLAQQTVMLRKNYRFQGGGEIGEWASLINSGNDDSLKELELRWNSINFWEQSDNTAINKIDFHEFKDAAFKDFLRFSWAKYLELIKNTKFSPSIDENQQDILANNILEAFADFQVLCAVREGPSGVKALNKAIADSLGLHMEGWYEGRPVMVTRNDYHLDLRNGDVGICLMKNGQLQVAFHNIVSQENPKKIRWVLPTRLESIENVFAMTVHKSQGSEFRHVCFVLPSDPSTVLTRELIYTGVTRAKNKVTWIIPKVQLFFNAVKSTLSRSGGLHVLHDIYQ